MRIIGGELRGRRIEAPPGRGTRPMLDRVREAMFSTLTPWLADGALVLDLFAGTGSLGLEALSRGARRARLVESSQAAVACLRQNVEALGMEARVEVVCADALQPESWRIGGAHAVDIVFLDPPYPMLAAEVSRALVLEAIGRLTDGVLASDGVLVCHTPKHGLTDGELPSDRIVRVRRYGTNALWYVQPAEDEAGEA